ncbi:hypothetical protein DSOUD_3246 [Desulfuromonas soudanensis]|uniref:Toxin VasX N-terminal region domain-containing protein n=1 Tax=Desulfuromonas soudanensis TaxID=1603606 RepID=A0A0M4CZ83_9BACT|nr:toxin VasX [Desulfuromonas soudanensis]ALC17966.1 hypothetical protein DSOUD_3246 [Desulfuromonas soudanensis]
MSESAQKIDPREIVVKPVGSGEQKEGSRELLFSVSPGKKMVWLKLKDAEFGWNNLTLGTVEPEKKGEATRGANVLVPVVPLRYTTAECDEEEADKLRPGWVYVFRREVGEEGPMQLWRELAVDDAGYFSDVHLGKMDGKDLRRATGSPDSRILLPYKVFNVEQEILMAYSEVQWSWVRVQKVAEDAELQGERLQRIPLAGYENNFARNTPAGNDAVVKNVEEAPQLYHLSLLRREKVPVVYLHDPLGVAERYIDAFFTVEGDLAGIIKGLPELKPIEGREEIKGFSLADKQAYYRSAVMTYRTFFDPQLSKRSRKFLVKGVVTTKEFDTPIGQAANEIDRIYLEEILAVQKRKELRAQIREIKRIYVEFLEGKFNGRDLKTEYPDFVDINAALRDFSSQEGAAFILFWDKVKELICFLNHDPSVLDSSHDIASLVAAERPKLEDDPGHRFLDSLLEPAHPLHSILFPSAEQVDIYTAEMDLDLNHDQQSESARNSENFRPACFATAIAASRRPPRGAASNLKNTLAQSEKIVADILSSFQKQWQLALKNSSTVKIEPLLRLVKGAKIPELAGMHIAKAGSDLGGQVVIDGKLRIMKVLNRHQRRAATSVAEKLAVDSINIVDSRTRKVIGSQRITDLGNFKGASPKVSNQDWTDLWGQSCKTGNRVNIVRTHADLVVVPETSPYVVKYHNPDAVSSSAVGTQIKALRGLSRTLPPLVAVLEGWNLISTTNAAIASKESVARKSSRILTGFFSLAYASTDAAIKIGGEEAVANKLANYGKTGRMGSRIVKGSIKIFSKEIKIFGAAGAGVAGLGAVMSAWEMIDSIQHDDDDAALGHGIAMAGTLGLALAGLGSSGVTMLAFLGPYGWAFMGVAILGSVLAYAFTDTDMEKWAKHGLFSVDQETRMTHEFSQKTPQEMLEHFMGMFMRPSMTMEKDTSTGSRNEQGNLIPDIVVEVIAPGFEPDLSNLDVRATFEEGEVDIRGHQPTLARLSGEQKSQTPYLIEQLYADEQSQQIIGVRYRYRAPSSHPLRWRSCARHITKDRIVLPQYSQGQTSKSTDMLSCHTSLNIGMLASHGPIGPATASQQASLQAKENGAKIIDTVPGWVYAKL